MKTCRCGTEFKPKRKEQSNKDLISFREGIDTYRTNTADEPAEALVGFDLYDSLLGADYGLDTKPKLIGELFGVKVFIDPMLNDGEIVFRSTYWGRENL